MAPCCPTATATRWKCAPTSGGTSTRATRATAGTTTSAKTAPPGASRARRSPRCCPRRVTPRAWARAARRTSRSWSPASRRSNKKKRKKNRPPARGSPRRPNPEGAPQADIPCRRADMLGPAARRVRRLGARQGGWRRRVPLRARRLRARQQLQRLEARQRLPATRRGRQTAQLRRRAGRLVGGHPERPGTRRPAGLRDPSALLLALLRPRLQAVQALHPRRRLRRHRALSAALRAHAAAFRRGRGPCKNAQVRERGSIARARLRAWFALVAVLAGAAALSSSDASAFV